MELTFAATDKFRVFSQVKFFDDRRGETIGFYCDNLAFNPRPINRSVAQHCL